MKATIERSPNLIFNVEWTGYTNTPDGFIQRKHAIIDWLVERKYKFYMIGNWRRDCGPDTFILKTPEYIKSMYTFTYNYDVFFVPGHIDPNKLI